MKKVKIIFQSSFTQTEETEKIRYETEGTLNQNKRFFTLTFMDNDDEETTIKFYSKTLVVIKGEQELSFKLNQKVNNQFVTDYGATFSITTKLNSCVIENNDNGGKIAFDYNLIMGDLDGGSFTISVEYMEVE